METSLNSFIATLIRKNYSKRIPKSYVTTLNTIASVISEELMETVYLCHEHRNIKTLSVPTIKTAVLIKLGFEYGNQVNEYATEKVNTFTDYVATGTPVQISAKAGLTLPVTRMRTKFFKKFSRCSQPAAVFFTAVIEKILMDMIDDCIKVSTKGTLKTRFVQSIATDNEKYYGPITKKVMF